MTPDDATIIRQCWIYARLNAKETEYGKSMRTVLQGRPYFVISKALAGCGYSPTSRHWDMLYAWMYTERTTTCDTDND